MFLRQFLKLLFASLFLFSSIEKSAAQKLQLLAYRVDSLNKEVPLNLSSNYENEQDLANQLRKIVPSLQEQGYLAASIDSIHIDNNRYEIYYFAGQQYRWADLKVDSIPAALLVSASINPQQYIGRPINPKSLAKLSEKLLRYCEENGYPFARIWLSDIKENAPNSIAAQLRLERAELRKIDSIIISGSARISSAFIYRYLDIAKGSLYNERKLKSINQRIRELAFLQEAAPWVITFRPGDTRLSLFLKEKKANQLNAILGLMPNNLQANKLLVTADVQLALQNYLGNGESISASFQNLQEKSPRFKADVIVPYLYHSPLGVEGHFDYFRNGFQFHKVSLQTGLRYQFSTSDLIRVYYQSVGNRIIEIDTQSILATKQLPSNIDTRSNGLGLELQSQHTDYRLNPHKGWQLRMGVATFQRKILPNAAIGALTDASGFDYNSLYDTLTKISYQHHLTADGALFFPLGSNFTLKIAYLGGYIASPRIFQNELFQIGGFKLLRGFDEQSIFANQYHISVTELRLRLNQNSFVYLFSDNGWVQTKFNNYNRASWYNGFGLGTTLETKNGLFSIALAFGRSDQIPLRFRESKLSFGYIALF